MRHFRNNGSITSLLTNDFVTFSDPTRVLWIKNCSLKRLAHRAHAWRCGCSLWYVRALSPSAGECISGRDTALFLGDITHTASAHLRTFTIWIIDDVCFMDCLRISNQLRGLCRVGWKLLLCYVVLCGWVEVASMLNTRLWNHIVVGGIVARLHSFEMMF